MKKALIVLSAILFASTAVMAEEGVTFTNVWIPEAPPVVKMMAGYLTINNSTNTAVEITDVSSPDFGMVEMHKSLIKDGMSRMIKQDMVAVPANSEVKFEPGGLHLMLMGSRHALKTGDKVEFLIRMKTGESRKVIAEVRSADIESQSAGHTHNH